MNDIRTCRFIWTKKDNICARFENPEDKNHIHECYSLSFSLLELTSLIDDVLACVQWTGIGKSGHLGRLAASPAVWTRAPKTGLVPAQLCSTAASKSVQWGPTRKRRSLAGTQLAHQVRP